MGGKVTKAIPFGQPNAGTHEMVMERLRKTYISCGGRITDEEKEIFENLPRFEGLKYILSKKLEQTRKAIARLDDGKKGEIAIRRKQVIRKYLVSIDAEYRKLEEEFHRTKKPPLRWLKMNPPPPKELIESRGADLDVCKQHVDEVKLLFKARYRDDLVEISSYQRGRNPRRKKVLNLLGGSSDEEDEEDDGYVDEDEVAARESDRWMDHVAVPDDPEASNLPAINITAVMQKVKQNRKQMNQKLELVNDKLDEMKEHAELMTEQIEEGGEIAEELREKIEKETENLVKVNKKVDKSIKGVTAQTKMLLCIVVMICIIFSAIIIYVVLIAVGVVPGGIKITKI